MSLSLSRSPLVVLIQCISLNASHEQHLNRVREVAAKRENSLLSLARAKRERGRELLVNVMQIKILLLNVNEITPSLIHFGFLVGQHYFGSE